MALSLAPPSIPHMDEANTALARLFSHELEAYLQGSSEASSAARRLLAIFYGEVETLALNGKNADTVEMPLGTLWTTILATATQIPHDHPYLQRLAELLLALKTQPAPGTPAVSSTASALLQGFEEEWGQLFWVNLPVFGLTVRNTQGRNPAEADKVVEVQGRIIPANLGEEPYTPNEWASLRKLRLLCTTTGVMDLRFGKEDGIA
jgi:hypothetical protein